MHAVIKTGGKQYRIKPGDEFKIERLGDLQEGDTYTFDHVLAVGEGDTLTVGAPLVDGALVKATVTEQGRLRKVIVFKKRRRKDYRKKRGHRQHFTRVRIESITDADGKEHKAKAGIPSKKTTAPKAEAAPKAKKTEAKAPKKAKAATPDEDVAAVDTSSEE